jgi:HK97 family phage major capsid protein
MDIRARVEALNITRLKAWEAGKALLEATEGRQMDAEELESFERINAEITSIDAEVRQLVDSETREREAGILREHTLSVFGETGVANRDAAGVDQFRLWLAAPRGSELRSSDFTIDIQRVARERELVRQGASADEIRALAWDASSGSLVVPTTMARSLYDVLEEGITGFSMGATRMNTSTGENMQLPKLTTHAVGTQVASQNLAIGGSDPVMGRVDVNVFKYGQLVTVANELVSDGAFGIEQFLGQDIGYALARVIDADLIVGTGSSEPTGYTRLAGAGTNAPVKTGGSLVAPTVEKFIDLQYSVNDSYRRNAAWLMKDSTAGTIRKLRDGAGGTVGAFLWEPSLTNGVQGGVPDRFLGSPVYTDANCAAQGSNAIVATYGDPSEYVIRTVGNPVIERDDSYAFNTDSATFRGKWRVGGNHRQVSAVNNLIQNV